MVGIVISPMVNLGFSFALMTFLVPLLLIAYVGNYLYLECIFELLEKNEVILVVDNESARWCISTWWSPLRPALLFLYVRQIVILVAYTNAYVLLYCDTCVFGIFKWWRGQENVGYASSSGSIRITSLWRRIIFEASWTRDAITWVSTSEYRRIWLINRHLLIVMIFHDSLYSI